jgi:hypothetical protein
MSDSRDRRMSSAQLSLFDGTLPGAAAEPDDVAGGVAPAAPADDPVPVGGIAMDPDARAREFAIDPHNNVVLEASAGTGKTSVLVWRYVNLLKAGVEPGNILAITFTRKAAAEMRERIVRELKAAAARSEFDRARWNEIRDRLGEIAISTIDAFSLSLLREFPLEADLDPGFEMADETEVPRLVDASLDQSLAWRSTIPTSHWSSRSSGSGERAPGSRRSWSGGSWPGTRSTGFSRPDRRT